MISEKQSGVLVGSKHRASNRPQKRNASISDIFACPSDGTSADAHISRVGETNGYMRLAWMIQRLLHFWRGTARHTTAVLKAAERLHTRGSGNEAGGPRWMATTRAFTAAPALQHVPAPIGVFSRSSGSQPIWRTAPAMSTCSAMVSA
jgi:hypothetical protein